MLPSWRYSSIHSSAVFSNCFCRISRRRSSRLSPLIGVLEPGAVLGAHGNVADGGEAAAAGSAGKPLRVLAPELHIHQSTVTDVVVVGRGQGLDDAGLDPLPTPAEVPHPEGTHDP